MLFLRSRRPGKFSCKDFHFKDNDKDNDKYKRQQRRQLQRRHMHMRRRSQSLRAIITFPPRSSKARAVGINRYNRRSTHYSNHCIVAVRQEGSYRRSTVCPFSRSTCIFQIYCSLLQLRRCSRWNTAVNR